MGITKFDTPFEKIQYWYSKKYYTVEMVWNMVAKEKITEEEYYIITGIHYPYKSIEEEASTEQ